MKRTARWLCQFMALGMVLAGIVLGTTSTATATSDYGYLGASYAGVNNPPTSDKPQSKLWWNDGSWWADMWTPGTGWQIYRLDVPTKTWVTTGVTNDNRASTLADTMWDGTHLYIASHVVTVSGDNGAVPSVPGQAKLYRYSYSGGTYTLDSGFPSVIANNSSESMTIDKDSTGAIWATWTQVEGNSTDGFTNTVYVNRSAPGGTDWLTPFILPVSNPNLAPDDISAIVAYGANKIGVMWSDQTSGAVRWATRTDGTNATASSSWKMQDAVKANKVADDHISVKTLQSDNSGRVYAAIKTSFNNTPGDQSAAELMLLVYKPGTGAFTSSTIATVDDCVTRPQILLDTESNTIHAFHTGPASDVQGCSFSGTPGAIYEKTASMDNPVFPDGRGTPIIQDGASASMNDVTTTKQSVNSTTGLVVLASNEATKRYWFAYRALGSAPYTPPVKSPFADVPTWHVFYKEIAWLADQKITTGWDQGNGTVLFQPSWGVQRDQMAAFLYRRAGSPDYTPPAVSKFADVPTSHTFFKEISWLADQKISTGWDEGNGIVTFRPGQVVLRDQMAAFLYRAAGSPAYTAPAVSRFSDVAPSATFYKQISWLAQQRITTGWDLGGGNVVFRPEWGVQRDQNAAFLYRMKYPPAA